MQNKKQDVKCEWKYISYTEQGNRIVDVVRTSFKPACHIKRVNKTLYMKGRYDANKNFVTLGEVFETSRKESPMRNRRSLKKIFKECKEDWKDPTVDNFQLVILKLLEPEEV